MTLTCRPGWWIEIGGGRICGEGCFSDCWEDRPPHCQMTRRHGRPLLVFVFLIKIAHPDARPLDPHRQGIMAGGMVESGSQAMHLRGGVGRRRSRPPAVMEDMSVSAQRLLSEGGSDDDLQETVANAPAEAVDGMDRIEAMAATDESAIGDLEKDLAQLGKMKAEDDIALEEQQGRDSEDTSELLKEIEADLPHFDMSMFSNRTDQSPDAGTEHADNESMGGTGQGGPASRHGEEPEESGNDSSDFAWLGRFSAVTNRTGFSEAAEARARFKEAEKRLYRRTPAREWNGLN